MRRTGLLLALLAACLVAGCGFKLRGSASLPGFKLPFATLAITLDPTSDLHAHLKRNIEASSPGTKVVEDAARADAVLTVLVDRSQKDILSLSAAGRAREYRLLRTFTFKVTTNPAGGAAKAAAPAPRVKYTDERPEVVTQEYLPTSTITLRRDIVYDDSLVLSKESEESLLWRDMQSDLVQQLLRRLAAARLQPVKGDD